MDTNEGPKQISKERYIALAMAATADIDAIVWSDAIIDGMGMTNRVELLKQLRMQGCTLDVTPWGYRVSKMRTSAQMDIERLVRVIEDVIYYRVGEKVTEDLAKERARAAAQVIQGEFDLMRKVVS